MTTKVIDTRRFSGTLVVLKFSDNLKSQEMGRAWFAVIDGKINYPSKSDAVIDERSARSWLNHLCREAGLLRK
jgi:hypothetical protein